MAQILCPHCGAENPEAAVFCRRCGAEMRLRATDLPTSPTPPAEEIAQLESAPETTNPQEPESTPPPPINYWGQMTTPTEEATTPLLPPAQFPDKSLLAPGQSFLEPVNISGELTGDLPLTADDAFPNLLDADRARQMRILLQSEPEYAQSPPLPVWHPPSLRTSWVFVLLALAVVLPLVLGWLQPTGEVQEWPGVTSAFDALTALPQGATVLVYWAYDPATAGELDLVALPVISQMLEEGHQSLVVATRPLGLAAARRLYARAAEGLPARDVLRRSLWLGDGVFLAGGAAALPLVGQDQTRTFGPASADVEPALVVVAAAQADDVQQWNEQAQTRNRLSVVAITAAGADPVLRPYLDSGQLVGLVSGFDGAAAFQSLRKTPLALPETFLLQRQIVLQNWGQFALLTVILLGNLAALLARGRRG